MNFTCIKDNKIQILECGGILKKHVDNIESPSRPDSYSNKLDCSWIISAPLGFVILLTFLNFKLEYSYSCRYDYLAIYDNDTYSGVSQKIGQFCGTTLPPILLSTSNMMTLRFKTDETVSHDGFVASYVFVSEEKGAY